MVRGSVVLVSRSFTLKQWQFSQSRIHRRIGIYYLVSALLCTGLGSFGGWMLWFFWPATALGMVGLIYFGLGVQGFQKRSGKLGVASAWLFAPYRAGAWINSRLWTWRNPRPVQIADGVWLGRMPSRRELKEGHFSALLDLTAEFSTPKGPWHSASQPWLDLVPPDHHELLKAAAQIEQLRHHGDVLVCCALGFSRSAAAVAAWLLTTRRAPSVEEAAALIEARRPATVLGKVHRVNLQALVPGEALVHA